MGASTIGKPRLRIDIIHFRRHHETVHDRRPFAAAIGTREDPRLSSRSAPARRSFGGIVAGADAAVVRRAAPATEAPGSNVFAIISRSRSIGHSCRRRPCCATSLHPQRPASATATIGASMTKGAVRACQHRPAMKVCVLQCPNGTLERRRRPLRLRPTRSGSEKTVLKMIREWCLRCKSLKRLARPERFELPTPKFVVWCSIQLSYGRATAHAPRFQGLGSRYRASGVAGSAIGREASEPSKRSWRQWQAPTMLLLLRAAGRPPRGEERRKFVPPAQAACCGGEGRVMRKRAPQ